MNELKFKTKKLKKINKRISECMDELRQLNLDKEDMGEEYAKFLSENLDMLNTNSQRLFQDIIKIDNAMSGAEIVIVLECDYYLTAEALYEFERITGLTFRNMIGKTYFFKASMED